MTSWTLDPNRWPALHPVLIAHDVGGSRDRSTAVVGGYCAWAPGILGIKEFNELPQGLYGSARASALAQVDARYDRNALIVADLSNDTSYGEQLFETFGPRVIAVHIGPRGEVCRASGGRSAAAIYLFTTLAGPICWKPCTALCKRAKSVLRMEREARRAFAQLEALELEMRESMMVYKCLSSQHDDLGISCAMLNWAARHPHLEHWIGDMQVARRPRRQRQTFGWRAFT
jgi:hypothetical protein